MVRNSRSSVILALVVTSTLAGCKDSDSDSKAPAPPATAPAGGSLVVGPSVPSTYGELDPTTLPAIPAVVPSDFVPQQLPSGEMKFKTPPAWKKADRPGAATEMTLVMDDQKSNLKLQALDLTPDYNLVRMAGELAQQFPGAAPAGVTIKHAGTEYLQVAKLPAAKVMFEMAGANGKQLKQQQVLIQKGKKVYQLTWSGPAERYDALSMQVDQMLESIEFK